jgi:histidinol-phosphate aminotransferase
LEKQETLHLQYGINLHADHVYNSYEPLKLTPAYPDPEANELRGALAEYVGATKEMIMCGNGSDELIDVYIRTFTLEDPMFTIAVAPPMYYQYPVYAERVGAKAINLPYDRSTITPALVKKYGGDPRHTTLMLDTPSNPAGDMVSREQIIDLLEAGYRLFVDEAYYEFCGQTVADLIPKFPEQLIISRTLSKFCAMSGSRLGYVIADPAMIAKLHKLKMLFNVNSDAQRRGLFALQHMDEFHEATRPLKEAKNFTHEAITKLGNYQLFPSLDLFVIFKHATISSPALHEKLRKDFAIETYLFDNFKGHSVIRSATAKPSAMQRLVDALAQIG